MVKEEKDGSQWLANQGFQVVDNELKVCARGSVRERHHQDPCWIRGEGRRTCLEAHKVRGNTTDARPEGRTAKEA